MVTGGQQRAIIVDVDPDRLRAHHLSLDAGQQAHREENLNLPAGIAQESDTEYTIRSLGWFTSPDEMSQIPVGSFNGQFVSLGRVASVRIDHQETRLYTRLEPGRPRSADHHQAERREYGYHRPGGPREDQAGSEAVPDTASSAWPTISRSSSQTRSTTSATARSSGGVLAILILLFFLRNVRSTLVVALSIPISIISTFALLYVCGFTLNTMSLGGLALATGLIVDDAVVVLENIFRHIERDKKRAAEAAVSGTSEIASAVVASTLTIMVVFLPLLLIKGQAGQMFTQFALVVIFSIAVSLLDATTVVPMLASRLIQGEAHHENAGEGTSATSSERLFRAFGVWFDALDNSYRNGLRWAMRHRLVGDWRRGRRHGGQLPAGAADRHRADAADGQRRLQHHGQDAGRHGARRRPTRSCSRSRRSCSSNPNVRDRLRRRRNHAQPARLDHRADPYQGSVTVKLKEDRSVDLRGDERSAQAARRGCRARAALVNQFDLVTMIMTGGNQNVEVDIFGDDLAHSRALGKT